MGIMNIVHGNHHMHWVIGLLIGFVSFLLSSFLFSLFIEAGVLVTFLTGVVGSGLLFVLLGYREHLIRNVGLSTIGMVGAILLGFAVGEMTASLVPSVGESFANAMFLVTVTTVFGTVLGVIVFGKKTFGFFFGISLLTALALTVLIEVTNIMQGQFWQGVDLNYVLIVTTIGMVAGLALGLFEDVKHVH
ncbi:hypothetical protein [Exiguobacterium alkaliphilum]|uniref:hypothetical protein n=2 Tax=Exiguobacterium alkaliphilum TaxID=1428684 RepID=UPI00403A82C8